MNPRKRNTVLTVLAVLLVLFIWGQSLLPTEDSAAESGWVLELVTPVLELFVGKGRVTDHLVRKLAHFTEFTALGLVFTLLFGWGQSWKRKLLACNLGLIAALLDETVQLFSHRGSQVQDIWLDFAGVVFGSLLALAYMCMRGRLHNGKLKMESGK